MLIRISHFRIFVLCCLLGIVHARAELPVSERFEYDIKWGRVTVGRAVLTSERMDVDGGHDVVRVMEAKSHGWVSLLKRIDNTIQSVEHRTAEGPTRYEVSKQISEGRFRQHDVLKVDTTRGLATWEDRLNKIAVEYEIPDGVKDYVTMMFELRELGQLPVETTRDYRLIMDDAVHDMTASTVATGRVKTVFGELDARRMAVVSHSPGLFVRNIPGAIWVCPDNHVILSMEVATKLGNVRTVLTGWSVDGVDATRRLNPSGVVETAGRVNNGTYSK